MKFFRYGKFSFADYWGSWISIIILLAYSVCCIVLHLSLIFVFFSLVYAFIWLIKILVTINESFMIVDNDIIISNQLVYFWLRLNKDDIYDIEHGRRNAPSDVADFIKYVKSYCAMNRENLALDGTINPVLAIFHQKAYDGLKDTPDVHVLPIAVPQALNQTDILKQFGMQALEGKKEKDF